MEFESIEQQVEYINSELNKGRSMVDIEKNDFKVNERVIHKRLVRKGYKRVEGIYVYQKDNNNKQYNSSITTVEENKYNSSITAVKEKKYNKSITMVEDKEAVGILNTLPKELDVSKLIELTKLIDPIKAIIETYNRNENIIDIEPVKLNVRKVTNVKPKLFKVDIETLERWDQFTKANSQYKVQDLISLALEEFITKYS